MASASASTNETGPGAPPDPAGRRAAWGILALVVATVLVGELVPGRPPHAPPRDASADPACLEWSDGCRVCARRAEGPACSLPGIACTVGPVRCLRRAGG